jgi:hypothetical protein
MRLDNQSHARDVLDGLYSVGLNNFQKVINQNNFLLRNSSIKSLDPHQLTMKVPFQFMLLPIILANAFSVPFQAQPSSFAGPMGYLLGGQESSPDISVPTYYPPSGDPSLYLDDVRCSILLGVGVQ